MKDALINGQLIPADSEAPATATCPHCGGFVKLRNRRGTYFWRHVELPREGCTPTDPEPGATEDDLPRRLHQVGDLVVEQCLGPPDRPHLKLRSLDAGKAGEPLELAIPLREVRPLATALLDAAAELTVAVRSSPGLNDDDDIPL